MSLNGLWNFATNNINAIGNILCESSVETANTNNRIARQF